MSILKLITFISILLSGLTYAKSDLDNYYNLEQEVAKLRARFSDNQGLISKYNTVSSHFWSPSSTKKIIARITKDQERIFKEMKLKVEKMKRIEQSLKVKAWDYRWGTLDQIITSLGNVSSNRTCSDQGHQLFTSNKAFEAWNSQNGDLDKKVAYYAEKNRYIRNCIKATNEGRKKVVSRPSSDLCKKINWLPDSKRSRTGKYKLKKENGAIILSAKIYFKFKGHDKDKKEAFKKLQSTQLCMTDFYAKHGIKLDLTFHEETGFSDWINCDHSINLHTKTKRANSKNWASHGAANPKMSDSNRCALYLHEFGHRLGLSDTYIDPDCPDREVIYPDDDIMNGGTYSFVENNKLYPTAIYQLLEPLCGE
jgi:hypothetical protein